MIRITEGGPWVRCNANSLSPKGERTCGLCLYEWNSEFAFLGFPWTTFYASEVNHLLGLLNYSNNNSHLLSAFYWLLFFDIDFVCVSIPWLTCGDHVTTYRSWFSPCAMQAPGINPRCQAWWREPSPSQPSGWPSSNFYRPLMLNGCTWKRPTQSQPFHMFAIILGASGELIY